MTNHVHVIAVPRRPDSLAKALGQTHWRYAMRFNRRYRRSGHLWQNRFYSCPLGPSHLASALAYVDLNPLRAGLVGEPTEYPWSSARAHIEGRDGHQLLDEWEWSKCGLKDDWTEALASSMNEDQAASLRSATYGGLALGDAEFVAELERNSGRRLHSVRRGPTPQARKMAASAGG